MQIMASALETKRRSQGFQSEAGVLERLHDEAQSRWLRPEWPKAGAEFLGRGRTSYSLGSAVSSPVGFVAEPRPPSGFSIF